MNQTIHQFKAEFFKILGHPARLAILDQLRTGEKSVSELQIGIGADQAIVSQQLARLRSGQIVDTRKEGNLVYYSIRDPLIFELLDVAREIFNNQLIGTQEILQQLKQEPELAAKQTSN
ncbi:MAG TPA: metalloregulator ArsR/SmtB family transcription factor [Aggregatilineales bacterium]|nr:metalloregulator ArsR/SmtB family transcription factor [Aggregatilineales bacterium]